MNTTNPIGNQLYDIKKYSREIQTLKFEKYLKVQGSIERPLHDQIFFRLCLPIYFENRIFKMEMN